MITAHDLVWAAIAFGGVSLVVLLVVCYGLAGGGLHEAVVEKDGDGCTE